MVKAALLDVAFMKGIVDAWGFWGLTFLCMTPMVAFIGYVWWHDSRQSKKHH